MPDLPKRTLGRTGFEATTLGYGAMELRALDDAAAAKVLNAVLDAGINFIDTSIDYGLSEELIGRHIAGRRHEYFLASKCGCVPGGGGGEHVHTAANIRAGVENSLRLMNTDHLDLVQFHRSLTEREFKAQGALQEVMKLRDEGKVRFIGVSGTLPNMIEQVDMGVFDAFQVPYSALQRDHEDMIARASAAGAGIIVRGGVARGAPSDWQNRRYYMVATETMKDRWEEARLDELLSDGMTRIEFMLRFTLSNADLDTTIVGTKSVAHLQDNIAAAPKGPLPAELVAEAKRRLTAAGSVPEPVERAAP
jgi:aryl-alcohol dehydrogenase-like predicted oxidoreductase